MKSFLSKVSAPLSRARGFSSAAAAQVPWAKVGALGFASGLSGAFAYGFYHRRALEAVEEELADLPLDDHKPLPANPVYDGVTTLNHAAYPEEKCPIAFAPDVPPPITRKHPVILKLDITSDVYVGKLTNRYTYKFWGFQKSVPGPIIRARVGDVLDVTLHNKDDTGMPHNIDFHSVTGPGGGASCLNAESLESKRAAFKLLSPGLFIYHCAAAPVPMHIANGMYGLILVEPEHGLTPVDKEYYVLQSEFYYDAPEDNSTNEATYNYAKGLAEEPDSVVFNGREGALTQDGMLKCKTGDRVRIFFGNAGPNLTSAFHIIGAVFDKVYREGDLVSPPARGVQTTTVPAGGAAMVELRPLVPGNLTLVDHAIFRMDKGAVGFLSVSGDKRPDIYYGDLSPCTGCKLHP